MSQIHEQREGNHRWAALQGSKCKLIFSFPVFIPREVICALSHHLLQWFLKYGYQIFHRSEPSEEIYNSKLGYWQQHTWSEKQDVFQFWESKGLLAYVQTMNYVLNIAPEWKTFYMTLWEEKNKSRLCTLLEQPYWDERPGDWNHWSSFSLTRCTVISRL